VLAVPACPRVASQLLPPLLRCPCAGAATTDIIQQYVSTIKALAHVDPGGTILGAVGDPIRAYLRERKDTIRCIVTMLTNDEEDAAAQSLFAELGNTDAAAEVGWRGGKARGGAGWGQGAFQMVAVAFNVLALSTICFNESARACSTLASS
jgi:hypothetical protein